MSRDILQPAFPTQDRFDNNFKVKYGDDGMTLRDYFAAAALAVVASTYPEKNYGQWATDAYYLADEMLKRGSKTHD